MGRFADFGNTASSACVSRRRPFAPVRSRADSALLSELASHCVFFRLRPFRVWSVLRLEGRAGFGVTSGWGFGEFWRIVRQQSTEQQPPMALRSSISPQHAQRSAFGDDAGEGLLVEAARRAPGGSSRVVPLSSVSELSEPEAAPAAVVLALLPRPLVARARPPRPARPRVEAKPPRPLLLCFNAAGADLRA